MAINRIELKAGTVDVRPVVHKERHAAIHPEEILKADFLEP